MTKSFARFARNAGLTDTALIIAIERAEAGGIDADLGGNVMKQRIARPGEGRSGGFRTLILFRLAHRAIFAYGFAKNVKSNITPKELEALRELATELLGYSEPEIQRAVRSGALIRLTPQDP